MCCELNVVVKWAQRSNCIFLTVELPDAREPKVKLEPEGKFCFNAIAGPSNDVFEIELELFDKVDVEATDGKSPLYLKVDWNKWVDEDEEAKSKFDDFDFNGMDDFAV
ncbi:hypothetical protein KP509_29G083500 [Ceratopteris richardii]|uniref:CS domain-containing protein n=1 Tax=Ceratopteris richardii TaxID=49495 RepID=A0A8T2RAB5_CERRI|nr:hypothetical protein KP509_29G083500 [Ceratopteris richardii]